MIWIYQNGTYTRIYKKEEQAPIKKIRKIYNLKSLKQIARQNIKLNDKEIELEIEKGLDKKLAKKMINP